MRDIEDITENDMVLGYGEDGGCNWHEVDEVCSWDMENPVKIKHKRVESLIIPGNQTVLIFDEEIKWKRAKNIQKNDRTIIPLDHDYLDSLEDRFWSKFPNFEQEPEYALGLVRGVAEIEIEFLEYIREEKPSREKALSEYSEKKVKRYKSFITKEDGNLHLNTKAANQVFEDYKYLKTKGETNNYTTTGGTLKVNV